MLHEYISMTDEPKPSKRTGTGQFYARSTIQARNGSHHAETAYTRHWNSGNSNVIENTARTFHDGAHMDKIAEKMIFQRNKFRSIPQFPDFLSCRSPDTVHSKHRKKCVTLCKMVHM